MSTIELIILGILQKKPMNAYELANFIDERQVGRMLKISTPAIYKTCKRLYKANYLDGETIREGENPEKVVYSVNPNGKKHFFSLMEHFSGTLQPFYMDFNAFLWNIDLLKPKKAIEMLENLKAQLIQLKQWVIPHENEAQAESFAVRMIIKQYRMVLFTLVDWIEETIDGYKKEVK